MKLLFDENLSPKLPWGALFPDSRRVRDCGGHLMDRFGNLREKTGSALFQRILIFSKEAFLFGHPPKVVWLRLGNCTRERVIQLMTVHQQQMERYNKAPFESVLLLWGLKRVCDVTFKLEIWPHLEMMRFP